MEKIILQLRLSWRLWRRCQKWSFSSWINRLFANGAVRSAFRNFIQYGCPSTDKINLSAAIRIVALMTNVSESLPDFVTSSGTENKNGSQGADLQRSDVLLSKTNKGCAALQERLWKLKLMLPVAASNHLMFCFKLFREGCGKCIWDSTFGGNFKKRWIDRWKNEQI